MTTGDRCPKPNECVEMYGGPCDGLVLADQQCDTIHFPQACGGFARYERSPDQNALFVYVGDCAANWNPVDL